MKRTFSEKVYQATKQIPPGKVASYGQIAKKLGKPKAARAVGNCLHHNPDPKTIPCHRVVNREGRLAPGFKEQKEKLLKEGVKFRDEKNVDLKRYGFTF
jgi:methylated-DNA-protein-cysteine methyltransferase-like protein